MFRRFARSFVDGTLRRVANLFVLLLLSLVTGLSGLTFGLASECETAPVKADSAESEIFIAERKLRRRVCRQVDRLPRASAASFRSAHQAYPVTCWTLAAVTEHALRNGGIGTSLRC